MAIVLDFDGTITTRDTIGMLAEHAISFHKEHYDEDFSGAWKHILEAYGNDYSDYVTNYPVTENQRTSLGEEAKFLNGLEDLDLDSVRRVEESRIFDRISPADFFSDGVSAVGEGRVTLRPGISELLALAESRGWPVYVVSVNWSRNFIEGVLHHLGTQMEIYSNEVIPQGRISGPGGTSVLATSADKLRVLNDIPGLKGKSFVYFGDSSTDLECLTACSGIVLSPTNDSSLLKTLSRIGLTAPHVKEGGKTDKLLWARDFKEVLETDVLSFLKSRPAA
ncbi:hypothetical protein jhhlp_007205 [Lomentospora prolificans]|uniref:Haloacid dehalogenase-like hydrolase n=1 Tax=Lomentospora prolificans TaxID=41688 RepID=A0A2N3N207_9PEZI|nr:hypothetical protein jhhlp_007205 [Lomentospora prolificans]